MGTETLEFPIEVFPQKIQDFIEELYRENSFPKGYTAAAMLFAVSIAVGKSRYLKMNGTVSYASVFVAIVGPRGSNKTGPVNFALKPLYGVNIPQIKDDSTFKGLQLIVKDITTESLAKMLSVNNRGLGLHRDELAAFFGAFNKYNRGHEDDEYYLSVWSGDSTVVNRKGSEETLISLEPFLSIIGGLQPEKIANTFHQGRIDNGFFDRFLFVWDPASSKPLLWDTEEDLPSNIGTEWKDYLLSILNMSGYFTNTLETQELSFSSDARLLLTAWQNGKESIYHEEGASMKTALFRKNQLYALRFCILLHVMFAMDNQTDSNVIGFKTVQKATKLAKYFMDMSLHTYYWERDEKRNRSACAAVLKRLQPDFKTKEALAVACQMGISERSIKQYLHNQVDSGVLQRTAHGEYHKVQ